MAKKVTPGYSKDRASNRRKIAMAIVFLCIIGAVIFLMWDNDKKAPDQEPTPLAISENSSVFNQSFEKLLNAYYSLKDALVKSDTAKANAASVALVINADSLKVEEIEGDTSGLIKETARNFAGTISGSAKAVLGEPELEAKRKEFEMITDAMWSLTRTIQYNGAKVYYQYCPMAFDDKGAYWLSNEPEIMNPYFGDKMLNCGSVVDSVDYSAGR